MTTTQTDNRKLKLLIGLSVLGIFIVPTAFNLLVAVLVKFGVIPPIFGVVAGANLFENFFELSVLACLFLLLWSMFQSPGSNTPKPPRTQVNPRY